MAAEIIGVNIFKYKLLAFAVSSFYAGVAGALWTYYLRIANYENFTLIVSIEYLAMIIIGGLGNVLGAVLGAIFIKLFPIVLDISVVRIAEGVFGVSYGAVANFLANFQLFVFGADHCLSNHRARRAGSVVGEYQAVFSLVALFY